MSLYVFDTDTLAAGDEQMCWFIIDPLTGKYGEHVDKPRWGDQQTLYLHNLAFDAFFDTRWAFQRFMAPHPRPPLEDLIAFVVDGQVHESLIPLVGPELVQHDRAIRDFWKAWDEGDEGYPALVGRPMRREEKYWLVLPWLQLLAVGREQFYAGKTVERDEWLVNTDQWDWGNKRWRKGCHGRLRVFSDGTADAWILGIGLRGFNNENAARHELSATRYDRWEEIKNQPYSRELPDPPSAPDTTADDPRQPFLYEGE